MSDSGELSSSEDAYATSGSGSGSHESYTPPPSYSQAEDNRVTSTKLDGDVGFGPSSRNFEKYALRNTRKKEQPQNTDFVKGLIPMTMAGEDPDVQYDDSDLPYNFEKDPLLQESPESLDSVVGLVQKLFIGGFSKYRTLIFRLMAGVLLAGYTIYLGFAIAYSPYGAIAPCVFTGLAILITVINFVKRNYGRKIDKNFILPVGRWWDNHWHILKWVVYPAPLIGFVVYLSVMVTQIRQLQSLSGFVFFFCVVWLTSKHPDKVVWRPVLWGYTLQFIMALLVLQWDKGYAAVEWLSDYVSKIINFGFQGAAIIYGDPTMMLHPFLMMGLSLLIYIGAALSILYYFGITQMAASKLAWGMSAVMGTTAIETLAVAANIMLNGMDVMLMLRPYLHRLTMSELNCFQVGSTSTIAGFMFGILILYGAPPQHLLTAAVMSAPATIAIAKLNYPETVPEKSVSKNIDDIRLSRGTERNMFEAAANGSSIAGKTVLTVCVNYISFMSLLNFIDAGLSWCGDRVGYPEISFEWICSYLFFPIALLIGIDVSQCRTIAKVIGLKVFTTEIYAYQMLGQYFDDGFIDERSKALGTYALCGFSSLSTLAIAVGTWQVICPSRRPLITKMMFRVLLQANISCFTTACVAGLFYSDRLTIFNDNASNPLQGLVRWVFSQSTKLFS